MCRVRQDHRSLSARDPTGFGRYRTRLNGHRSPGADVILVSSNEERLESAAAAFRSEGYGPTTYRCDLTDRVELAGLITHVEQHHDKLDILVNAAGTTSGHPVFDYPDEDWDNTFRIHTDAPFMLARGLGKLMGENGGGSIINITSINAERGFPGNPAYVAAIRQFASVVPDAPRIGCFEPAFHGNAPLRRQLYAVPWHWYEEYGIRRYGFHGASHRYAAEKVLESRIRADHLAQALEDVTGAVERLWDMAPGGDLLSSLLRGDLDVDEPDELEEIDGSFSR